MKLSADKLMSYTTREKIKNRKIKNATSNLNDGCFPSVRIVSEEKEN